MKKERLKSIFADMIIYAWNPRKTKTKSKKTHKILLELMAILARSLDTRSTHHQAYFYMLKMNTLKLKFKWNTAYYHAKKQNT